MTIINQMPVIAGVEITTDSDGRFNLNALHKASGLGKNKQPTNWLRLESTKELIEEIKRSSDMRSEPIESLMGGKIQGTFAHELLAISYAGWISPSFQLKVNQVFIDHQNKKHQPAPKVPQSRMEILQLAIEAEQENIELKSQMKDMQPKVAAFDLIAAPSSGSLCISDAAKHMNMRPKDLFDWLKKNRWIYRRTGSAVWIAYQDRIQVSYLEHKLTMVTRSDGTEKTTQQVRVTQRGLAKLATEMRIANHG